MTPNEALERAYKGRFGANFVADQDPDELAEILKTAMVFYSENTVVENQYIYETTELANGEVSFTVPSDMKYVLGLADDEGIEQLYRLSGGTITVRKCAEASSPLELMYAVDLTDWDLDTDLPSSVRTYQLIDLIYAYIGEFNNSCLKAIGKFTQVAEEASEMDYSQKIAEYKEAIQRIVYIPQGKSF